MKSNQKVILLLGGIFFAMLSLHSLFGLCMGDDYVYSFLWEGHSIYEPISENARRIESFADIVASTWLYYLTWGGRLVAQGMAMFFLWMPKGVFDIAASGVAVLLVLLVPAIICGPWSSFCFFSCHTFDTISPMEQWRTSPT